MGYHKLKKLKLAKVVSIMPVPIPILLMELRIRGSGLQLDK